ncbi:MAG: (2Fe-2S)-binding protein [Candidatus Aminicenantes bacterium]|nr:MAG: (2Fe-2S)-binding protein [Candidatus Aminicenantes bacterium]RLE05649.1 MAG: (2Fe-2S)-binding protein [Candidatus Aminicenantes bacterium]HHF43210.1 (2Fe-2S)-binding protein [Candidatus Aminicenantes bacterium]
MDNLRIPAIKRKEKINLYVNGKPITAYAGETVLAALLAAGYKIIKKNPVSQEPRGALCGMGVCFECTVTINGVPNIRACVTEVQEGMRVELDD